MLNAKQRYFEAPIRTRAIVQPHRWVAVPDPHRKNTLLYACDCCGVVMSENTCQRSCGGRSDQRIISDALLVVTH